MFKKFIAVIFLALIPLQSLTAAEKEPSALGAGWSEEIDYKKAFRLLHAQLQQWYQQVIQGKKIEELYPEVIQVLNENEGLVDSIMAQLFYYFPTFGFDVRDEAWFVSVYHSTDDEFLTKQQQKLATRGRGWDQTFVQGLSAPARNALDTLSRETWLISKQGQALVGAVSLDIHKQTDGTTTKNYLSTLARPNVNVIVGCRNYSFTQYSLLIWWYALSFMIHSKENIPLLKFLLEIGVNPAIKCPIHMMSSDPTAVIPRLTLKEYIEKYAYNLYGRANYREQIQSLLDTYENKPRASAVMVAHDGATTSKPG